jgi:hypothetical protein
MPTTGSEDDDIVMRAVEERVKQWKVCLTSYQCFIQYERTALWIRSASRFKSFVGI